MARRTQVKEETVVNRPIVENVEVERPVSTRAKWDIDRDVMTVIETAETGKARKLHMSEALFLHKIHMAMRHALKGRELNLHYKKIDEKTLVAWAERAKKMVVALVIASLLPSCSGYMKTIYGDSPANEDYTACLKAHPASWGNFHQCMRDAGWEQAPGTPESWPSSYRKVRY
jgi:hypothetical protein